MEEERQQESRGGFASIARDFVCFGRRRKTEIPFLLKQLEKYKNPRVFDACLGSGATTIGLHLAGIHNIVSNEIDPELLVVAQEEATKYNVPLIITTYDWRGIPSSLANSFDVVLCLGNSITLLFDEKERRQALENFRMILRNEGTLIIDERNYPEMLKGNYRWSGNFVYCGKNKVDAFPVRITSDIVTMRYCHRESCVEGALDLYPFKRGELESLLRDAGFSSVKAFGDYKERFAPEEPEFLTYVCEKK